MTRDKPRPAGTRPLPDHLARAPGEWSDVPARQPRGKGEWD